MSASADRPPRILAVETSSRLGSIALGRADELLVRRTLGGSRQGRDHLAQLLPGVDEALGGLGWNASDIDQVFVSAGPGSFTGLRIAITFARTLAQATGARIVLVPSAEVLAANAPAETLNVAVILDAKRGQIYTAVFSRASPGGPLRSVVPVGLKTPAEMLAAAPRPLHLLGEGIDYHRDSLRIGGDLIELPRHLWPPQAEAVYRIGRRLAQAGRFTPPDQALPVYIRRPEAEEKWERLHGG